MEMNSYWSWDGGMVQGLGDRTSKIKFVHENGCETKFFEPFASAGMSVKLVYRFLDKTAGASGKAALPRTHSKTWRRGGGESCARSVVECGTPFRFGPATGIVAPLEEFCITPPAGGAVHRAALEWSGVEPA
jgi:hypothetical protein